MSESVLRPGFEFNSGVELDVCVEAGIAVRIEAELTICADNRRVDLMPMADTWGLVRSDSNTRRHRE